MQLTPLVVSGLLAQAHGAVRPLAQDVAPRAACPAVWEQVKAEFNTKFMDGSQCNGFARASIRAAFHDCGSWDQSQGFHGGCDGSLVVATTPDVELDRSENNGLQTIAAYLKDAASRYGTSVADMIVFAGGKSRPTSSPPAGIVQLRLRLS